MFVILRNRTKEKLTLGFRILVTLVVLGMVLTHLYTIYNGYIFTSQGLLREDRPSGNPMRVEGPQANGDQQKNTGTPFDKFVVKLKDFYDNNR